MLFNTLLQPLHGIARTFTDSDQIRNLVMVLCNAVHLFAFEFEERQKSWWSGVSQEKMGKSRRLLHGTFSGRAPVPRNENSEDMRLRQIRRPVQHPNWVVAK